MNTSHKKIIFFDLVALLILFINSFYYNFLSTYYMILFILLLLGVFHFVFIISKKRSRYINDVLLEVIIFLLIYFIVYYLLGLYIGFAKVGNYYTFEGMSKFIVPTILTICIKEFLRYQVINKCSGSKLAIVVSTFMFLMIDVSNSLYFCKFDSAYSGFIFIALTLLPAISNNILGSYIALKVGYKPVIVYSLVIGLYQYLIPIVPNPTKYLSSVIQFLLPLLLVFRVNMFMAKNEDEFVPSRGKKSSNYVAFFVCSILIFIILFFSSGYFGYNVVAIATGSMEPVINKGDVVIIKEIEDIDDLEVGQTIAFKYSNVIIVHRIINIKDEDNKRYIYTKGDNNANEDNWVVEKSMVQGIVDFKIPYIGIPTIWLNDL